MQSTARLFSHFLCLFIIISSTSTSLAQHEQSKNSTSVTSLELASKKSLEDFSDPFGNVDHLKSGYYISIIYPSGKEKLLFNKGIEFQPETQAIFKQLTVGTQVYFDPEDVSAKGLNTEEKRSSLNLTIK